MLFARTYKNKKIKICIEQECFYFTNIKIIARTTSAKVDINIDEISKEQQLNGIKREFATLLSNNNKKL